LPARISKPQVCRAGKLWRSKIPQRRLRRLVFCVARAAEQAASVYNPVMCWFSFTVFIISFFITFKKLLFPGYIIFEYFILNNIIFVYLKRIIIGYPPDIGQG
jgi:hypothetical protein